MSLLKSYPALAVTRLAVLTSGDLLVILSFVWIGRGSHRLPTGDIATGFFTALPFLLGWFLVVPWFGLYKADVSQNWRKLVPRLLLAWAIGGPLALALRALFLERSLLAGFIPIFAAVALGYIGLLVLLWRLSYAWWVNRSARRPEDIGQARG
jgi:TM2 domain-containing membrane protein YozV